MYNNGRDRGIPLLACLACISLATGCLPRGQAGQFPTTTPHPIQVLTGVVRVGEPIALAQASEQLNDPQLGGWLSDPQINGDVLLATTGAGDDAHPVAINLSSGETAGVGTPITTVSQWRTDERYFAYTRHHSSTGAITRVYVYDTQTGEEFAIEGEGGSQCCPYVSGDLVVWSEIRTGNSWDICAYDVSSRELIPVVTRPFIQGRPKIEGNWMIYLEDKAGDPRDPMRDLYLHNLATAEDMRIGPSPYASDGLTYGIVNNRIYWVGWSIGQEPSKEDGPLPSLHVYDLNTREEEAVDTSAAACPPTGFSLVGSMMKWACDLEHYTGYDLEQQVFFEFPILPEEMRGRVESWETLVSNNWVVWYVVERGERVWDYMTPGAPPMPEEEYWLTPQPARFRLYAAPITR